MTRPSSCPGCGADYRPECRYCGRRNDEPRLYAVSHQVTPAEIAALQGGLDGVFFRHADAMLGRRRNGTRILVAPVFPGRPQP